MLQTAVPSHAIVELMTRFLLLSSAADPRAVPVLASVAAHAAIVLAAAGVGGGRPTVKADPVEVPVDIASLVTAPLEPAPEVEHRDIVAESAHEHARAEPHSHPYPVAPDHDAHPHSPQIDHRASAGEGQIAPAPPAAAAPDRDADRPRFSIVLGPASGSTGGASSTVGTGAVGADAPGSAARAPAGEGETFAESSVSEHARLVSPVRPEYPAAARALGVEGTVSLELVVDREGRVVEARVVRAAGHGFDDSALRALRGARFRPALREGQAVRVRMPWTIDFRLE
jgi:TonB family protein